MATDVAVTLHHSMCMPQVCTLYCMPAGSLYGREVLVIPVDFTEGQQVYEDIAKQLADLDIGVLGKEWTYWHMSVAIVYYYNVPCFLLALHLIIIIIIPSLCSNYSNDYI